MEVGVCFRYARDIPGEVHHGGGGESIGDVGRAKFFQLERIWKSNRNPFFFFNINIAKSIRNQSILFKIWQVKGKSNRSTKLEAVCANEQRKRCFELSNERCLFSLPSPAISFPATIHGRGSFHSADTRESWASFEELICFVSFERALDAVACFRGSRNGGSRIESRQTRE